MIRSQLPIPRPQLGDIGWKACELELKMFVFMKKRLAQALRDPRLYQISAPIPFRNGVARLRKCRTAH